MLVWVFQLLIARFMTPLPGVTEPPSNENFQAHSCRRGQRVEDLKFFDKWTDPATPLPDLLSGFVSDFATKELGSLAGNQIAQFQVARQRIADFLQQWEDLGHTASTMLWSAIQKAGGPVTGLLNFLRQTNGLDDAGLKALIETELGKTGFLSNPIGQWLEAVTANDVLSLLNSSPLLGKVRSTAQMVLSIADGKVLDNLVQFVDKKLHIADVEKIVSEADFNNLDPWLKSKLAAFLGKPQALIADLDKIRAAAKAVRDKATALYQAAIKALNNTYTAALHYTYAKTTTSTALVDVSFDFNMNPSVGAFMKLAIQGDFTDLLLATNPGITLKSATLTHGVKRQSHVQVVLPYFSDTIDHINNSLVTMNVVEDKGRLFVYDLKATDQVVRAGKWSSTLTLTGKFTVGAGVRVFVTDAELSDSMTFSYNFRQSLKSARDVQLENVLQPLVDPYFHTQFGGPEAPEKASLHEWIGILDNRSTDLSKTGSGSLGNVLLSLDVSLPGKAVAAWFNAPADKHSPIYLQMSQNIQVALRRYTQFAYFNDPARYHDIAAVPPIFVYGCLPVSTDLFPGQLYFDFEDSAERQKMVLSQQTADKLMLRVSGIRDVLRDSDKFKSDAGFYDPHSLNDPLNTALSSPVLHSLLFTEAETIQHAQDAAMNLAAFSAEVGRDPQEAIQALTDFGAKITDAFNKGLGSLIPRLDELSSMIFLEAARAFDPVGSKHSAHGAPGHDSSKVVDSGNGGRRFLEWHRTGCIGHRSGTAGYRATVSYADILVQKCPRKVAFGPAWGTE